MSRVFYAPAPYPADEVDRQRVVTELLACDLDTASLAAAAESVAKLFGTPIAALTMLDHDRQWIAAASGIGTGTTARTVAFCGYTIREPESFCVLDASRDARFAGNPLVRDDLRIRFYVGAPLIVHGAAIGALCAVDNAPRHAIAPFDLARLRKLAAATSATLAALVDAHRVENLPTP